MSPQRRGSATKPAPESQTLSIRCDYITAMVEVSASGKSNIRETKSGNIVPGVFTPVLAKHSKSFSLIDCIAVGVDRMQRNFEPMRKQVEAWQRFELTDVTAKVVIYEAFVEGKLEAPKHLARTVHDLYFEPKYEEFQPRTIWSLSNAFTSAFKERSHPTVQGHGEAGRIPGNAVLAIVLTFGSVGRPHCPQGSRGIVIRAAAVPSPRTDIFD